MNARCLRSVEPVSDPAVSLWFLDHYSGLARDRAGIVHVLSNCDHDGPSADYAGALSRRTGLPPIEAATSLTLEPLSTRVDLALEALP